MGPVLDGVADHMKNYSDDQTFLVADAKPVDAAAELKKARADVLVNYMPVGSQKAAEYYAQAALDADCGFVNCMPVFIVSDSAWGEKFKQKIFLVWATTLNRKSALPLCIARWQNYFLIGE